MLFSVVNVLFLMSVGSKYLISLAHNDGDDIDNAVSLHLTTEICYFYISHCLFRQLTVSADQTKTGDGGVISRLSPGNLPAGPALVFPADSRLSFPLGLLTEWVELGW